MSERPKLAREDSSSVYKNIHDTPIMHRLLLVLYSACGDLLRFVGKSIFAHPRGGGFVFSGRL